jgi:hypothetical protein
MHEEGGANKQKQALAHRTLSSDVHLHAAHLRRLIRRDRNRVT